MKNPLVNISLIALVATVITYALNNYLFLGPVLAASTVGLISAVSMRKYSTVIYAGALAGMTSSMVTSTWWVIVFIGALTGIIFYFLKPHFIGEGGKLGTAAFLSVILTGFFIHREIFDKVYLEDGLIGGSLLLTALFFGVIGAVATRLFAIRLKKGIHWHNQQYNLHPTVFASAVIGLTGVVLAYFAWPNDILSGSLIIFTGSFVGMSTKEIFPGKSLLPYVLAGLISALIFVFGQNYFDGFGGKIGFIAFLSVFIVSVSWKIPRILRKSDFASPFPFEK